MEIPHLQLRPLRNAWLQSDIYLGPPGIIRRTTLPRISLKLRVPFLKERVDAFLVVPASSQLSITNP